MNQCESSSSTLSLANSAQFHKYRISIQTLVSAKHKVGQTGICPWNGLRVRAKSFDPLRTAQRIAHTVRQLASYVTSKKSKRGIFFEDIFRF